jgi:acyl-CoA reductase-like NAD-dependent aldehyde dehydrogenase
MNDHELPPLVCKIDGEDRSRTTFASRPVFYPDYTVLTPQASLLDVSQAIGAARQAERLDFAASAALLGRAAEQFNFTPALIRHTVRTTGLPYAVVRELLGEIPLWLREVPRLLAARFRPLPGQPGSLAESLPGGAMIVHTPLPGYCYAVLPGTDPRASALVLANLVCLGIPVILKASRFDAVVPAVLDALLSAGLDPHFASLLYFDNHGSDAEAKHSRLVSGSSVVWTFGPRDLVHRTLRYASQTASEAVDLFAGKTVLYHDYAACAAVIRGPYTPDTRRYVHQSLAFASGCTAARTVFLLEAEGWIDQAVEGLRQLRVGDPLDPATEVGYVHPSNLDTLQFLVQRHAHRLRAFGGERLSAVQMAPLMLSLAEPIPDLLGEEIPAYYLAACPCPDFSATLHSLNHTQNGQPRLAVSLFGFKDELPQASELARIHACTILRKLPTATIFPYFHEGHDYVRQLTQTQFFNFGQG